MKNNKLLCVILALLVCLTVVVSASATAEEKNLTFTLVPGTGVEEGGINVKPGDEFSVIVSLDANPGFYYLHFGVEFDAEKLELVKAESVNENVKAEKAGYAIGDASEIFTPSAKLITDTGSMLKLTFKAKQEVATTEIKVVIRNVDVIDENLDTPEWNVTGDSIEVNIYDPGHVCADHAVSMNDGKPATCTEEGLTDTIVCGECGRVIEEQKTIEALGHTEEVIPGVPATCTEAGLTDGSKCTVCGEIVKEREEIAALGHDWIVSHRDYNCEETCTEDGYGDWKCSRCDETKRDVIPATGHDMVKTDAVAATCTADGTNEYYTCNNCGVVFKDAEGMTETTVEAEVIPAIGHDMVKVEAVDATCIAEGNNEYYVCNNCGKAFKDEAGETETTVEDEVIAIDPENKNHDWDEGTVVVEPTHFEVGSMSYTCKLCGETKTEEIETTAHEWSDDENSQITVEPGCATKGEMVRHCTIEGCEETKTEEIEETLDHTFPDFEKNPELFEIVKESVNCSFGVAHGTCADCDAWIEVTFVKHAWDEGVVTTPALCVTDGVMLYTCTNCGETKTEVIPATLDHQFPSYDENPELFTVIKEGTCSTQSVVKATCKYCDAWTEVMVDSGKQHTWVADKVITAPTCGSMGVTEMKCSACDATMRDEKVPASGEHTWDEGKVTTEATTEAEGVKTFTCTVCKQTKTETIEKLEPKADYTVVIVVIVVVVVLAGAGVGAYFLLKKKKK